MVANIIRTACLVWLLLPGAALAGMYKCKQPNGGVAYQDAPCAQAAAQEKMKLQGVDGDYSQLALLLSRATVKGLKRPPQIHAYEQVASIHQCVEKIAPTAFAQAFDRAIQERLGRANAGAVEAFFNSKSGAKFGRLTTQQVDYMLAGQSADAAIGLSPDESRELAAFKRTEAGRIVFSQRFGYDLARAPVMIRRMVEIAEECESR